MSQAQLQQVIGPNTRSHGPHLEAQYMGTIYVLLNAIEQEWSKTNALVEVEFDALENVRIGRVGPATWFSLAIKPNSSFLPIKSKKFWRERTERF
ncbi:unnamed protein product [Citrullus colocynthis]|uniref:Uncharacterized protein n=1 Tax=Citrullus colocynthis TaxID=252529 RepID=A0ABP0XTJ0_9ROSI